MIEEGAPPSSRKRSWMWVTGVGIALGVGAMVVVFASRFGVDPRLVDSPLIGEPVPALELELLAEDGSLALTDLRGQVLVVNFWASWCFPCRGEHPALTAVARDYEDLGVRLVGVVYQDEPGAAMGFLDQLGWGGDNYQYVMDSKSRAAVEFGVFGVPETYFVDAEGIIVGKVQGEVTSSLLRTTLDQILAGQRPEL
ncbi:MAG: redoxin domain-containing protein [Acidimicrobiia bacterium]|nr:redoxin domain-containing protein [Acidimicrobiia bacterium]